MQFNPLDKKSAYAFIQERKNEKKLGESLLFGADNPLSELKACPAKFVILGVPESMGPKANHGFGGAETAWEPFLKKFLNMQSNDFLSGAEILLLGAFSFEDRELKENSLEQNSRMVVELDVALSLIIEQLVSSGKIPIVIGGGHNNAYGLIKGCAEALDSKINVSNLDPHADYRPLEGRHSGNGFSYAQADEFLGDYHVLGLHEAYNSEEMLGRLKADGKSWRSFESIFIHEEILFEHALEEALQAVNDSAFGIELDMDSIQDFPSSAQSPSGISANQARKYVSHLGKSKLSSYLHLPEAAPKLVPGSAPQVGKLLAYLVSDFIKARK